MKIFTSFTTVILAISLITLSCRKDINEGNNMQGDFPDLSTKVSSSVSGFVTNEQDEPVYGATVKAGAGITKTDKYGFFQFNDVMVVKEAAVISVEYSGYFNAIKTYAVTEGKPAFFRIKLLPKTIAGTIESVSGGTVSLQNGLSISFPANAVKDVATGLLYNGTVKVAAQWLDPTSAELNNIMPGDLRGINTSGSMDLLTTYGMAAVEITGSGGESLKSIDGKKAEMSFPIPATILATAPATIPLWYFDEQKGLWKEEGIATKTGDKYIGEVSHFSFWNCDVPNSYVPFSCIITDSINRPLPNMMVKISVLSNLQNSTWGYTNEEGFVSGFVPNNETLKLEVLNAGICGNTLLLYSQNFTTTNIAYAAGIINITGIGNNVIVANIKGKVIDCNNNPVTNGYIILKVDNQYSRYYLNTTGEYNITRIICNNAMQSELFAVDISSMKLSETIGQVMHTGTNIIPDMQACSLLSNYFDARYSMNGFHNRVPYNFPYIGVEMHLVGIGANDFAFYWPDASSNGHPIGIGPNNQLSWYGPSISPVIKFSNGSNEIADVYNLGGPTPVNLYSGSIQTHNYYDSVSRKIYVAWQFNNDTGRAFFDTLTYIEPR